MKASKQLIKFTVFVLDSLFFFLIDHLYSFVYLSLVLDLYSSLPAKILTLLKIEQEDNKKHYTKNAFVITAYLMIIRLPCVGFFFFFFVVVVGAGCFCGLCFIYIYYF